MQYSVSFGGEEIGTVDLEKRGLYYYIDCRCRLSGQVICCLIAKTQCGSVNLGTMLPDNGYFHLKTCQPVKKLGEQIQGFAVEPKHQKKDALFIPVSNEEPFCYLERLSNAYLAIRNGEVGIEIRGE